MNDQPTTSRRIFLSYARDDDEPFVRRLYGDLTKAGFDVWFDRVSMPSRSLTFHHEIRDAIAGRDRLVLVAGPKAVVSDYVIQEWQFAYFAANKCVNPIVRLDGTDPDGRKVDGYTLIPEDLKLLHAEDFRDDARYTERLENLVRQLSEPLPPVGKLVAVPELPPGYRAQPDRLRALRDMLLIDLRKAVVVTGAAARVGLQGMGGIGKSVLANALAHHPDIQRAFRDNIFWITLGQTPHIEELQRWLARQLGDEGMFNDIHAGKEKLRRLLAERATLLILDDVWERQHADAFNVVGPLGRILLTTRDTGLVTALAARENHYRVELPTRPEAEAILASAAAVAPETLPDEAREIIDRCDRLPLALALCGGMVHGGTAWRHVLEAIRDHDLEFLSADYPAEEQHRNAWVAMDVSLRDLSKDQRDRFAELSVFGLAAAAPGVAVATLWGHTAGMGPRHAAKLLADFARRSLVQLVQPADGGDGACFDLHDLLHNFAEGMAIKRLGSTDALHRTLLDAYRAKCPEGWHSGPNDGYFFENLCRHFIACSRWDSLTQLLTDLRFLERRGAEGQVPGLVRDFQRALAAFPQSDAADEPYRRLPSQEVRAYASAMMSYASSWTDPKGAWRQPLPEPIAATGPLDGRSVCGTPAVGPNEADGLARLRAYYRFVIARAHALTKFGISEGYLLQEAYAFSCDSLVSRDAEDRLEGLTDRPILLPASSSRPRFHARPALLRTMATDEHMLEAVSLSWDGRRAVSGGHANVLRVWDLDVGECLKEFGGHHGYIHHTYMAPDGTRACSSDFWGQSLRVWDLENWKCERLIDLRLGCNQTGFAKGMAVTPDLRRAVTGGWGYTLALWDLQVGRCLKVLREYKKALEAVCMTADGRKAVWGSWDTLRIWNLETGECSALPTEHDGLITALAITPDGKTVVSGGRDHTIRVWDLDTRCCRQTFRDHVDPVMCLSITPDGRWLISGGGGEMRCKEPALRVWDLEEGRCIAKLEGHTNTVQSVDVTPDGTAAVSCGSDSTIRLWDIHGESTKAVSPHKDAVTALAGSPGGRMVLSAGRDGSILAWDYHTGQGSEPFDGDSVSWLCLAAHPGGSMAISGGNGDALRRWDVPGRQQIDRFDRIKLKRKIVSVPDVLNERDGKVETGPLPRELRFDSVAVSGDGRWALSLESYFTDLAKRGSLLRIWDWESGAWVARGEIIPSGLNVAKNSLRLLPDGKRVLCWCEDEGLGMWRTDTMEHSIILEGMKTPFQCLAVSPDGRKALISTDETILGVFDLRTGNRIRLLRGHDSCVNAVRFSPDGVYAISASDDETVRVWELEDGRCILTWFAGEACSAISGLTMQGELFFGTSRGNVTLLRTRNLRHELPVVTAGWMQNLPGHGDGKRDLALIATCAWCGRRIPVPCDVSRAIRKIPADAGVAARDSPCLSLPSEAWADRRLVSACPSCANPNRFNPFLCEVGPGHSETAIPQWARQPHADELSDVRDVLLFVYYATDGSIQPSECKSVAKHDELETWLSGVLGALHETFPQIPREVADYVLFDWSAEELSAKVKTVGDIPSPGIVIAMNRHIGILSARAFRLKADALRDANMAVAIERFVSEAE